MTDESRSPLRTLPLAGLPVLRKHRLVVGEWAENWGQSLHIDIGIQFYFVAAGRAGVEWSMSGRFTT